LVENEKLLKVEKYFTDPVNKCRSMGNSTYALYHIKERMKEQCKIYLEIGVLYGYSMSLAIQSEYPTKFCGIDLFGRQFKNDREERGQFEKYVNDLTSFDYDYSEKATLKRIMDNNGYNHPIELIPGNSQEQRVINYIQNTIGPVDMLYIDGDHSYRGVKADFKNYAPLVSPGGIIVLDDQDYDEVRCYVNEVATDHKELYRMAYLPEEERSTRIRSYFVKY